jgi:hypothetical protein
MKTKTKIQPQRTCAFKKILSRMPPLCHWPNRPEKFKVSSSQVAWFIRNETGTPDWSRTMKLFYEASKNKVIIFNHDTRLWRGYLHGDKSAKLPTKWKSKNPSPSRRPDVPGHPLLNKNSNSQRTSAPDK